MQLRRIGDIIYFLSGQVLPVLLLQQPGKVRWAILGQQVCLNLPRSWGNRLHLRLQQDLRSKARASCQKLRCHLRTTCSEPHAAAPGKPRSPALVPRTTRPNRIDR